MPVEAQHSIFDAVILGIIQGLTEFLPVSSSGHLEIGKVLLNSSDSDSLLMTIVLHAATALSTVFVFRAEIAAIIAGLFRFKWNEDWQFAAKIVLSMIPAVFVGLFAEDWINALFDKNMLLVGAMLLLTGALLLLADRAKDTSKDVSFPNSLLIGISQAIAILPGVSRSGATISTAVLLGIDRMKAAKFSFLMVIPLIFGAMAKKLLDGGPLTGDATSLIVGFCVAFATGVIACKWMLALVKNCKLWWFSLYCFVVGALAIGHHLVSSGSVPTDVPVTP